MAPSGNEDRPLLSIRMAQLLCMRYQYDTKTYHSDLDRAISLVRESIHATSSQNWQRPRRIIMLGQILHLKWQESGDPEILNEAISLEGWCNAREKSKLIDSGRNALSGQSIFREAHAVKEYERE